MMLFSAGLQFTLAAAHLAASLDMFPLSPPSHGVIAGLWFLVAYHTASDWLRGR